MPRIRTRQLVVLLLSVLMLASAGCAGFGTDSPAEDPEGETDGNGEAQDGEQSPNEANDSSGDSDGNESESTDGADEGSTSSSSDDGDTAQSSSGGADSSGSESSSSDESSSDASESSSTDGSDTAGSSGDTDSSDTDSSSDTSDDTDADNSDESDETGESDSDPDSDSDETDETDGTDENGDGEEEVYTLTVEADSEVTIERHSDGATTSREPTDGTVDFSVYTGDYTVSADGYQSQEMTVEDDRELTLQEEQQDGTTQTIEVVHANEDDAPLPSTVTLRGEDGETYTEDTGDDGVAEFTVSDGIYEYEIEPHQDGEFGLAMSYAGDMRVGSDDFPNPLEVPMYSPPEDVNASMTVVDSETGEPIEGATIQGMSPNMNHPYKPAFSVETDANGQYDGTIPNTVTTGYDYEVDAEGYQREAGSAMTAEEMANQTFELDPESAQETYNATITVQDETGEPIDDATVSMSGQNETTDGGEATFEVDTPGGYTVTVSDVNGYERTQETVMVEEDGENEFTITLQPAALIAA